MSRKVAEIHIAGQKYKVQSSASDEELTRLSEVVTEKVLASTPPGRTPTPQSLLLAAMALAHELEEERARRDSLERKMRDFLRRILVRIDDAMDADGAADPH